MSYSSANERTIKPLLYAETVAYPMLKADSSELVSIQMPYTRKQSIDIKWFMREEQGFLSDSDRISQ